MDALTFFANPVVRDIGATGIVAAVVLLIISGRLIPAWTHKRELAAANARADEWKEAHRTSEQARLAAQEQNSTLLAGVRIADKFYGDFLIHPDETTIPGRGVPHVGQA